MRTAALIPSFNADIARASYNSDALSLTSRKISIHDVDALLAIERQAFDFPWTRTEFEDCLLHKGCEGVLVERDGEPVGYMFYEIKNSSYRLLNCAVVTSQRRQGVGAFLLQGLLSKLDAQRKLVSCVVREGNVQAQLFLRKLGFLAQWIAKGFYSETDEDAYRMVFRSEEWTLTAEPLRKRILSH